MQKNPFLVNIQPLNLYGSSKKTKKRKSISFTKKAILWERNKSHICHICRQKIHSLTEAEVDHIRAHASGGQKLAWAHRSCNRLKGRKPLSQIHKELGIKVKSKKRKRQIKRKDKTYNPFGINIPKIRF